MDLQAVTAQQDIDCLYLGRQSSVTLVYCWWIDGWVLVVEVETLA